jgi:hypothetical protein
MSVMSMARPGSLVSPFARHGLIFFAAVSATYLLASRFPAAQEATIWLVGGAVLGVLAGVVGRSWVGLFFLMVGLGIGLLLELHLRLGPGNPAATQELANNAVIYLASLAALVLGYAAVVIGMWALDRRS